MSFTLDIKKEIISKRMNKQEAVSFIQGIIYSSFISEKKDISILIKNKELLNDLFIVLNLSNISYKLINNNILFKIDKVEFIKPKNAWSFLSGVFFVCGSVSKLNSSSYHLQMSLKNKKNVEELITFVSKHINFSYVNNKNYHTMYIKKHELIADFLYILGAQKSYFVFIESVIERDLINQSNRIYNLDIYNQSKLVDSHQIFLDNYAYIKEHKLENKFKKNELLFFEFKKNNPYYSLADLSIEFKKQKNISKTKGGLNHWLIKLRKVQSNHEHYIWAKENKKIK